jgi:hypothetical protein
VNGATTILGGDKQIMTSVMMKPDTLNDADCERCARGECRSNSAWSTHGCRCTPCRLWHNGEVRAWRRAKVIACSDGEQATLKPVRQRVRIEQAIAFHGSAHAAAQKLGINYVDALRVLQAMVEGATP